MARFKVGDKVKLVKSGDGESPDESMGVKIGSTGIVVIDSDTEYDFIINSQKNEARICVCFAPDNLKALWVMDDEVEAAA